jgi:dynein heavy chain 1, cytosolic
VRLTLEAVVILLGEKQTEWNEIRKILRREDFISTVVNFTPENITGRQIKEITETYLKNEEFDYENVNRASKACGPLHKWIVSQLQYSGILRRVQPLREEVATLQQQSDTLQQGKDAIVEKIEALEASIARYKAEYAEAIREIELIKAEMDTVGGKVRRAEALLVSLNSEKGRWHITSTSFQNQIGTLIGDALLSASFLTYAGIFDHRSRTQLLDEWVDTLEQLGVPFRPDLSPADYLARPAQTLEWQAQGLPNDRLCTENAIILDRFNRFPLVIDPSGQATQFLMNKYASRKILKTSFMDAAFLKTLASCIRFGTPLLVQDLEGVDPILNPVLNKEFQRTGGRTIIRLGSEDIDYSPKFVIFLVTRNPMARFTPDICSRVTLVNFTVTPASLQSQALSQILRSERPDVDRRRTEVLRLQGEQNVKLRELEEGLLNQLSAVQGNILDDDRVIRTLEELKAEAADVGREVASTEEIMAELKAVSDLYEPLALACSQVYFTLDRLADVHFLYQYTIQYFLAILEFVLTSNRPPASQPQQAPPTVASSKARIRTLKEALLSEVCRRASKGLLQEDQVMFAIRLAQIYLQGALGTRLCCVTAGSRSQPLPFGQKVEGTTNPSRVTLMIFARQGNPRRSRRRPRWTTFCAAPCSCRGRSRAK